MIYFITPQKDLFEEDHEDIYFSDYDTAYKMLLKDDRDIAVDSETMGFDPYTCRVLTWQFGNVDDQIVLDMNMPGALDFVKKVCELNKERVFLMQNAKFDLRFLMYSGIYIDRIYDTFLVEAVLYNGIHTHRKGLDKLAERYTGEVLDKSIRGNIHREGLTYRVVKYAADDVRLLHAIRDGQLPLIKEKDLEPVVRLENKFVVPLAYAEICGMPFDSNKWKQKVIEDQEILDKSIEAMNNWLINVDGKSKYLDPQLDLFGDQKVSINWASPKQVVTILEEQGLDLSVKDKATGVMKKSVEAKVIKPQMSKSPLVALYLDYSAAAKVISTYGPEFLRYVNKVTGRIHTSYTQIKDTGRISSGGQGTPNLQNIPATPGRKDRKKKVYERECFIPEEGWTFVDCDYSSQESVILANFSKEPNLVEFYLSGASDLHSFVASKIYKDEIGDCPIEEIKDNFKALRQNAKAANFAIAYGGNGSTIAGNLSISQELGYQVEEAYFNAFPQLKQYFEYQKNFVLTNGYVLMNKISKRKTFIENFDLYQEELKALDQDFWTKYRLLKSSNSPEFLPMKERVSNFFRMKGAMERMSLNYPIQGTAGDQTKLAGIYLYEKIKANGHLGLIRIVNFIHDEILIETPNDLAEDYAFYLRQAMEKAALVFCKTVELKADPAISKSWEH